MKVFVPFADPASDYDRIRGNGMWYLHWQGGYQDIIDAGHPPPTHRTTVLCELHSPETPDFLHSGGTEVPFLVTHPVKLSLRRSGQTGFRFAKVEVTKIATKGRRKYRSTAGEPEDVILKGRNQLPQLDAPQLHAVYVKGRMAIKPAHSGGRTERGYKSPFKIPSASSMPDLWLPSFRGRRYACWTFCSERFKRLAEDHQWSNVGFEPADEWMERFGEKVS